MCNMNLHLIYKYTTVQMLEALKIFNVFLKKSIMLTKEVFEKAVLL